MINCWWPIGYIGKVFSPVTFQSCGLMCLGFQFKYIWCSLHDDIFFMGDGDGDILKVGLTYCDIADYMPMLDLGCIRVVLYFFTSLNIVLVLQRLCLAYLLGSSMLLLFSFQCCPRPPSQLSLSVPIQVFKLSRMTNLLLVRVVWIIGSRSL